MDNTIIMYFHISNFLWVKCDVYPNHSSPGALQLPWCTTAFQYYHTSLIRSSAVNLISHVIIIEIRGVWVRQLILVYLWWLTCYAVCLYENLTLYIKKQSKVIGRSLQGPCSRWFKESCSNSFNIRYEAMTLFTC